MDSGPERTREMTGVVARMRVVALGAERELSRYLRSTRMGERLAAIVILQLHFDPSHGNWLAERLADEVPFLGFHAASALISGLDLLVGEQRAALLAAVDKANQRLIERGLRTDAPRDRLIDQILQRASG
jgi:hypothetical protein